MEGRRTPDVSVVVATRDRHERLRGLLRSLEDQTLDRSRFEVIVVDDGSTDTTPVVLGSAVERGGLALRVEKTGGRGPAVARNIGWRAGRAPLVAFTDDDCEADPRWLEAVLAAAAADGAGVVQGRTVPMPGELDRIGTFSRTRSVPRASPWFETCNIAYPRDLLESLGGFDESFPDALGEDTDLGWRALEAGARHSFAAGAVVYHGVDRLAPLDHLRTALRGPDAVLVFRRYPRLRRQAIHYGVFRNPDHARLLLALAGVAATRRALPAAALTLPYLVSVARRARALRAGPPSVAYFVVYDLLQTYASARGSLRHRVLAL